MLKQRNRTKLITASGGGSLTADADESFLVKDIFCVASTNDTFLTVIVAGTTVAKIRVADLAGNHLPYPMDKAAAVYEAQLGTVLAWLRNAGNRARGVVAGPHNGDVPAFVANPYDIRFPVASGETLTISRYAEAGNVCLLYDVYDAGDVLPTLPNGTQSQIRRYLHYGTNAATAADGDCAVATSLIWSGGEDWPFGGGAIAERNAYRLLAVIGCPLGKGASGVNKGYTSHLKLIRENTVLFDEDRSGLPFKGDTSALSAVSYVSEGSVVGPVTDLNPRPGLLLDPPLDFGEGERLTTKIVIAGYASGGPAAAELDLAYALERRYGT